MAGRLNLSALRSGFSYPAAAPPALHLTTLAGAVAPVAATTLDGYWGSDRS